jgi:hypothetical protein
MFRLRSYTYHMTPEPLMARVAAQKGKALWWILLLAALAAGLVYYFYFLDRKETLTEPVSLPARAETQEQAEPEPDEEELPPATSQEPFAEVEIIEESEPLPALSESDNEVMAAAADLMGEGPAMKNLVSEAVIPRLVATINALTLEQLPKNILPLNAPGGELQATSNGVSEEINPETGLPETQYVLDSANFQRYTGQVEVFEAIDTRALIEQYDRYYPLLQESYLELGYPDGDFNDRLIEVIDHLLATPEPVAPILLVKPEAVYEFTDPGLEALSAGQKVLIRIGPSNAARVKSKLSEIRQELQTQRE